MRIDKLTTKFQEAKLGEAQSLALGNDHAYIEPAHVLAGHAAPADGPKALLQRAGVNVAAWPRRPTRRSSPIAPGAGAGPGAGGPRHAVTLLQAAEKDAIKRGDQFVASELFLLAWPTARAPWPTRCARPA
jgi:ATP-dependent Clp protease ATP-binding subunit ClpB